MRYRCRLLMSCTLALVRAILFTALLSTSFGSGNRVVTAEQGQYHLNLGDVLPATFFGGIDNTSFNFVNFESRLVGTSLWPVSPKLVQTLHNTAKHTCSTTGFLCHAQISLHDKFPGACHEECSLQVYPHIANVSACQQCGQKHNIWRSTSYASLDLTIRKNYTRNSMLVGCTLTTLARDVTLALQAEGLQAHCYALVYSPQPDARLIAQYKPLAHLALKAEGWSVSFMVRGAGIIPFGVEQENRLLVALNAMEHRSLYTSYWRFKQIAEDKTQNSVTVHMTCIRQPDRHGIMDSQEAAVTVSQLEERLQADGSQWQLSFLAARRAPEETLAHKFRVLATSPVSAKMQLLRRWGLPVCVTILVGAASGLLLLGSPGVIILPGRTTTFSSNHSIHSYGTGKQLLSRNMQQGSKKAIPLIMGDHTERADIEICQRPDGSGYWLLGKGSSGMVYKGIKNGVQDVAVKVLIDTDDIQHGLFLEEIRMLRSVSFDQNIVQFCGACLQPPDTMMILEYMAGGDLMRAIGQDTKNELRWSRRGGALMLDIARGLTYLHSNRLIHMDLKSKNILLNGSKDLAKIADVGLSRIIQSTLGGKQSDPYGVGTFEYTAPEILLGRQCSPKVDVYSFGVIMWEVASHLQPARGRMRDLRVPQEVPAEIDNLINSCLSEDPALRPTAKEAYLKLKEWKDKHDAKVSRMREARNSGDTDSPPPDAASLRSRLSFDDAKALLGIKTRQRDS